MLFRSDGDARGAIKSEGEIIDVSSVAAYRDRRGIERGREGANGVTPAKKIIS